MSFRSSELISRSIACVKRLDFCLDDCEVTLTDLGFGIGPSLGFLFSREFMLVVNLCESFCWLVRYGFRDRIYASLDISVIKVL